LKTFESLPADKQQRIINAALKEFADQGFDNASTNRIVKAAQIGKGMLFYYFKSKKDLFDYLIDFSNSLMKEEALEAVDGEERDFLKRMMQMSRVNSAFLSKYPDLTAFMNKVMMHELERVSPIQMEQLQKLTQESYEKVYGNIDRTLFREDIDPETAFQLIRWTLDGYGQDMNRKFQETDVRDVDMDPYFDEFDGYIEVLRKAFYKKEE